MFVLIPSSQQDIMAQVDEKATGDKGNSASHVIYGPKTEYNGPNVWDDITGKTNTDAANSATAALQEDAQAFNAEEAQKQRDFEANQAEIARQWQEMMSNSAVQRQAADLKAAGFNPWLATNGSGASTGSVGIANGDSASSAMGQGINASKSGAEMLAMAGITAASIIKVIRMLSK